MWKSRARTKERGNVRWELNRDGGGEETLAAAQYQTHYCLHVPAIARSYILPIEALHTSYTRAMDPLLLLRRTLTAGTEPELLSAEGNPVSDIADAEQLGFPENGGEKPSPIALSIPTRFVRQRAQVGEAGPVDLRAVYFCWLCRDQNVASYLTLCQEKGIANLAFVERTSLVTWLQGADSHSEFIVAEDTVPAQDKTDSSKPAPPVAKIALDPRLKQTYANERVLQDHNLVLDGIKPTVISLCVSSSIFGY